jgi:hypothetical protein
MILPRQQLYFPLGRAALRLSTIGRSCGPRFVFTSDRICESEYEIFSVRVRCDTYMDSIVGHVSSVQTRGRKAHRR